MTDDTKRKAGRPKQTKKIKYSPSIANMIFTQMESGLTVNEICRKYNKIAEKSDSPQLQPSTIMYWKRSNPDFAKQYDTAYESRMQYLADYIEDLSRAPAPDTGDAKRDSIELQQRKLEIDTIKFTLAKLNAVHFKQYVEVDNKGQPTIVVSSFMEPTINVKSDNDSDSKH
jgi:hypothetical protein